MGRWRRGPLTPRPYVHNGLPVQIIRYILFFFSFWLLCAACEILLPRSGIQPVPPAVEAWSVNHWTAREVPKILRYILHTRFYRGSLRNPDMIERYLLFYGLSCVL